MALLPPFCLDCVVAIGKPAADGSKQWVASGFLYGELQRVLGPDQSEYRVSLVTNRHVFENQAVAYLRFNPKGGESAREYTVQLLEKDGKPRWFAHPDPEIDVATIRINIRLLTEHGIQYAFFCSDLHVAAREKALELGITEGDFVYTLGFPLGLVGAERNFAIVRTGVIARIRDALDGKNKEFLIDASIFPGNSGGPVVTKPEVASIEGTEAVTSAMLIGMVTGYITYRDTAVSTQSGRPRVIFEENSGLAAVVPIDFVVEAVALAAKAAEGQ